MWIQNVSLMDIKLGWHLDPVDSTVLIQIVDPDMDFPEPKYTFRQVHRFKFLDVEEKDECKDEWKCSQIQAKRLVNILQHALNVGYNVIVHCHAGICRSGAVSEVGVMMGFEDSGSIRIPNLLVKHLMMKALGWTYDENEEHNTTVNGIIVPRAEDQ
jgi:DNA segregation ATPase FtsK/SpoIIIE-like protein